MNLAEWLQGDHEPSQRLKAVQSLCRAVTERGPALSLDPARIQVAASGECRPEEGKGTPQGRYRPPEIIEGRPATPQSPVYTAGVLCFEILGRPALRGPRRPAAARRTPRSAARPLRCRAGLPGDGRGVASQGPFLRARPGGRDGPARGAGLWPARPRRPCRRRPRRTALAVVAPTRARAASVAAAGLRARRAGRQPRERDRAAETADRSPVPAPRRPGGPAARVAARPGGGS